MAFIQINEETFKAGYKTYNENCPAVIDYYKNMGIFIELDGTKSPKEIMEDFENRTGKNNDQY